MAVPVLTPDTSMRCARVPFQKIVFVCVNRRAPHEACCAHRESEALAAALKARVKALGLSSSIRVSKSGCQDVCSKGPNVMVFPDYVWYHRVSQADVEHIVQSLIPHNQTHPTATPHRRASAGAVWRTLRGMSSNKRPRPLGRGIL